MDCWRNKSTSRTAILMDCPTQKPKDGDCCNDDIWHEEFVHLMRSHEPDKTGVDDEIDHEANKVLSCDSSTVCVRPRIQAIFLPVGTYETGRVFLMKANCGITAPMTRHTAWPICCQHLKWNCQTTRFPCNLDWRWKLVLASLTSIECLNASLWAHFSSGQTN